jgi:hypothetical protein
MRGRKKLLLDEAKKIVTDAVEVAYNRAILKTMPDETTAYTEARYVAAKGQGEVEDIFKLQMYDEAYQFEDINVDRGL